MIVLLLSTYELGRQPFGLASPAALLREGGHEVRMADLAVEPLPEHWVRQAGLIAFHLPMHTATRLAAPLIARVRRLNPKAHVCCYGLYATLNAGYLCELGVQTCIAGEFENALGELAGRLQENGPAITSPLVRLDRIRFRKPAREGLPDLSRYAALVWDEDTRITGYTEASRGCKHLCRHCPVVPVYQGRFRAVPLEIVMADLRQQIEAGASHITFGDPDFLNGPAHARRILEAFHAEFAGATYDVTVKIGHLLQHRAMLPLLKRTGCAFVTSAVESVDDEVLCRLEKGHTRADFLAVVGLFREQGLTLSPTFIPFTPWTTWEGYRDLLRLLVDLDLVENVAPVQLALRLLITAGSRLLELGEIRAIAGEFDRTSLVYRWRHADPSLDRLAAGLLKLVDAEQKQGRTRREIFRSIWAASCSGPESELPDDVGLVPRAAIPYLNEPWYC